MSANRIYDPEIEAVARLIPMLDISDVPGARETVRRFVEDLEAQGVERPTDKEVIETETTVPAFADRAAIPVRIYRQKAAPDSAPLVMNFHAGGFVLGDLDCEYLRCLTLCRDTGATRHVLRDLGEVAGHPRGPVELLRRERIDLVAGRKEPASGSGLHGDNHPAVPEEPTNASHCRPCDLSIARRGLECGRGRYRRPLRARPRSPADRVNQ